ncbi:MAG TPA: hypothetical protein VFB25_10135 [Gaiellaceae bacterium]|nr:hypothetical protein [Gaiellaceae bacterium]
MRGGVAVAAMILALVVLVPLAGSATRKPTLLTQTMTVTATPKAAAAQAVRLTVTLHYEMQCGYAGAGALVVTFPSAVKMPKQFAAGSVQLAGKPVKALLQGRRVTVVVPPYKGLMCDVLGPGSLALTFTRSAKLANPAQPGSYRFTATHVNKAFSGMLTVGS